MTIDAVVTAKTVFESGDTVIQMGRSHGVVRATGEHYEVVIDAATLRAFGSTTWTTDAGPLDILTELPVEGGRRAF